MGTRRSMGAIGLVLVSGLVFWAPIPAVAGVSSVNLSVQASGANFNHRCRWWNDWCNTSTTTTLPTAPTTTTTAPTTTTTTAPTTTTTTAAPTTTTTTAPTTTTTTAPTTTTTTAPTTTTTLPPSTTTTTLPPSTTTTTPTTTTRADAIGFLLGSDLPRGPAAEQVSANGQSSNLDLLVSLAAAFVGMAVQGLGYYLFVFLVPVVAAIWLSVIQRREEHATVET